MTKKNNDLDPGVKPQDDKEEVGPKSPRMTEEEVGPKSPRMTKWMDSDENPNNDKTINESQA